MNQPRNNRMTGGVFHRISWKIPWKGTIFLCYMPSSHHCLLVGSDSIKTSCLLVKFHWNHYGWWLNPIICIPVFRWFNVVKVQFCFASNKTPLAIGLQCWRPAVLLWWSKSEQLLKPTMQTKGYCWNTWNKLGKWLNQQTWRFTRPGNSTVRYWSHGPVDF